MAGYLLDRPLTLLSYFKKDKNTTETHKKRFVQCTEGAVIDQTCQKWFVKLCAGDFSLDDAPQSVRPVEVDSDQVETLLENNQCYTTWETAGIFKISKSIKLLVKIKNVSFMEKTKQTF